MKDVERVSEQGDAGLTFIGLAGFADALWPDSAASVQALQKKGIIVRLVTGDNIVTAKAVALKCGIITESEAEDADVCMEGPDFAEAVGENLEKLDSFPVKKLKIIARARPEDKALLANALQ